MTNDYSLHHHLEKKTDMPVETANVQKENKAKDTGKEGKERKNIGAQAAEMIKQAPVVHAV